MFVKGKSQVLKYNIKKKRYSNFYNFFIGKGSRDGSDEEFSRFPRSFSMQERRSDGGGN